MPTPAELLRVLLLPLLVSAIIAAVGRWRRWAWAMPVAAGVGFMAGFAAVGVPGLPPADGTDWLFWLAIPATLLGVLDATLGRRWGWGLGAAAGVVAWLIARPLVPAAVTMPAAGVLALVLATTGLAWTLSDRTAARLGGWAVGVAISGVVGATAVVVMSSNLRVVGIYGIAAAAAVGPAAGLAVGGRRGVILVAACLAAGLLTGGRFYADPGVTWPQLIVLAAAPILLWPATLVPGNRRWVRGVISVLLVAIAAAAVAVPTAVAAKHAAEDDPYAG